MRKRALVFGLLGLALLFSSRGQATSSLTDFRLLPEISVGHTITDLAMTPDHRYVLILSGPAHSLRFLDTWNFKMVSGGYDEVALGRGDTLPQTLTISPDGKFAYVGNNKGQLTVIDLSPLSDRLPEESVAQALTNNTTIIQGGTINTIISLPDINNTSSPDFFALMGYPTKNRVYWIRLIDGDSLVGGANWWPSAGTYQPKALVRGKNYGYILTDHGVTHVLEDISCSYGNCAPLVSYSMLNSCVGLVADPVADLFVATYEETSQKLLLLKPRVQGAFKLMDSFTVNDQVHELALLNQGHGLGPLVFSAGENKVGISEVNRSEVLFSGSYHELGASLLTLVASGGTDGYVYGGDATSQSVSIISANPWVSTFTAVSGNTVADLSFTFHLTGSPLQYRYRLYNSETFGAWQSPLKESGAITPSGATVSDSATVPMSKLKECENVLTLVMEDGNGRQGRSAIIVTKDTAPPAPGFSLGFGDRKIIVTLTAQNLCDLYSYEIFYGDSASVENTYAAVSANYTKFKTLSNPTAGTKYEEEIKGLTNGQRYYVQIAVWDKTNHVTLSARKSAMPERPRTLTELIGEKGGINCGLAPAGASDPWSLALWIVPWLLVGGLKLFMRRQK